MPMPTTRYGRFRVYRARAIRRRKLEMKRRPRDDGLKRRRKTSRNKPWNLWGKQSQKEYPRYVWGEDGWSLWNGAPGVVSPTKGRFGVIPHSLYWDDDGWLPSHRDRAYIGYQNRRCWSIPSARQRDWNPYLFPHSALHKDDYNPYPNYASGAPTYAFLQGWA